VTGENAHPPFVRGRRLTGLSRFIRISQQRAMPGADDDGQAAIGARRHETGGQGDLKNERNRRQKRGDASSLQIEPDPAHAD
jgi:hypothetical protein